MRVLLLCSCLLSLCMPANCQKGLLKADLLSLSRTSEGQVAAHIMVLAEKTHEPARSAVEQFARDLIWSRLATVRSSSPAALQEPQADSMVAEIDSVLKSAGTSTLGFHDHVGQFEKIMLTVGTPQSTAHKLAAELEIIGRQVRGPEDTPIR
ncbi:exported hypothetical protein [Candidatus Sulfopaludibacter sp. SbA4]|nr:exported hypothetical protein [Candidatus Sulfopaludibacter sp. SbA4]